MKKTVTLDAITLETLYEATTFAQSTWATLSDYGSLPARQYALDKAIEFAKAANDLNQAINPLKGEK